jgi:hypothetical protein
MLHTAHPTARPGTWRLEHHSLKAGDHVLHVSRVNPRYGRVHREFHPSVFGLTVELDVVWYRDIRHCGHVLWSKVGDGVMLGFLALPALGLFEHFHWAGGIAEGFTSVASVFGFSPGGEGH